MKRFLPTLVVAVFVALTYTFWPRPGPPIHYLEVTMRASAPGLAQLFLDSTSKSSGVPGLGDNQEGVHKFPLPDGRYLNLNFSPTDVAGVSFTVSHVRVIDRVGTLIRSIAPERVKPVETTAPFRKGLGRDRPMLLMELRPPLILKSYARPSGRSLLRRFVISFVAGLGLALLATRGLSQLKAVYLRLESKIGGWIRQRPGRVILVAATASVILSCYPVVLFGKSFLSPNNHSHAFLLYGEMPTVPGYAEAATDNENGADLGAAIWYSWPASLVEHRALSKDFELPLWNRYDSCGLPLLGQGQSMFGDPLHLIVLLAKGSAASWDLKYLLAKLLFAACLGFCVLHLTGHVPSAATIAATAPFIGFFAYRYSHPAFFSLCYAPFILLCWFRLIDAPKGRPAITWLGLMVLANWMVINSGTVKEAYVLLLAMNVCGCLTLLLTRSLPDQAWKLRHALFAQLVFVLIATPVWLTFIRTLQASSTFYDNAGAYQLQPGLFIGLFDDIFYQQFNANEFHFDPSLNFLVLAAVLWLYFGRNGTSNGSLLGLWLTCVAALAFVFGIVPASLITALPFLGRIHHIDNTFSCVAIVCLLVLAGGGVKVFWQDCQTHRFRTIYPRVLIALLVLFAFYLGTTEAAQRSTITFLRIGEHVPKSPFFWGYSLVLLVAVALVPLAIRRGLAARRASPAQALSVGLLFVLLHWRHGMHLATPFDAYVMNPQQRTVLVAESSPALNFLKARSAEPFRTAGLGHNFTPGYGAAVGLEQIDSADPVLNPYYRNLIDTFGIKLPFGSTDAGVIGDDLGSNVPLLDMLNVRYYLGSAAKGDLAPAVKRVAALDLDVYESGSVWPRAFFTDRLTSYGPEKDFVSSLKHGDGRPFAAIPDTELERHDELRQFVNDSSPSTARQIIAATHYVLRTNTTSFTVSASGPGIVVLTEPYVSDDFQVTMNGKPAPYFRVNSAFRGVSLPAAGEYRFSFGYWPRHLTLALWLSALGFALFVYWIVSGCRQSHRET